MGNVSRIGYKRLRVHLSLIPCLQYGPEKNGGGYPWLSNQRDKYIVSGL
jgi:hypothetical protein